MSAERYAALFRGHYERVVRWLCVLGIATADVDDVAQEVFVIAHRKLDQLLPDASTAGWLMGIARNVAATHRRTRGRSRTRDRQAAPPTDAPDPEVSVLHGEATKILQTFLEGLPDEQRLVFVLFEIDGVGAAEVAQTLGIPFNTVHSRVRLIREKLNRLVARHRAANEV